MEKVIEVFAGGVARSAELAAVLVVTTGVAWALARMVAAVGHGRAGHAEWKSIWRGFGVWLLMGLEFELAADIVRSVISPSWLEIGQLACIALIRTFLNYFLEKDVAEAAEGSAT